MSALDQKYGVVPQKYFKYANISVRGYWRLEALARILIYMQRRTSLLLIALIATMDLIVAILTILSLVLSSTIDELQL